MMHEGTASHMMRVDERASAMRKRGELAVVTAMGVVAAIFLNAPGLVGAVLPGDQNESRYGAARESQQTEHFEVNDDIAPEYCLVTIQSHRKAGQAKQEAIAKLSALGFQVSSVPDFEISTSSVVYDDRKYRKVAEQLAKALGIRKVTLSDQGYRLEGDVLVLIGVSNG